MNPKQTEEEHSKKLLKEILARQKEADDLLDDQAGAIIGARTAKVTPLDEKRAPRGPTP